MAALYGRFVRGGNGGRGMKASPEFWRMIEDRRRRATRSLEEAKAGLFVDE